MSRSKLGAAQSASSRLKRHPSSFQKPGTGQEKEGDGWAEVHLSTLSKFRCFMQEIERRREIAQFSFLLQIFCLCWRSWQQGFWGKSNYIRFNEVHDIKLCSKDCTQLHQNSAAAQGRCLVELRQQWLAQLRKLPELLQRVYGNATWMWGPVWPLARFQGRGEKVSIILVTLP